MTTLTARPSSIPLRLDLEQIVDLDGERFFDLCQRNRELRIEKTAQGEIVMTSPAGGRTSSRNSILTRQLAEWSERDGSGAAFDSSGGFELPNGAVRSPDAAWVELERLRDLAPGREERFLPLCPTFVVELRSPSDTLDSIQAKMEEYVANGARLGWLIDPRSRRVYVYRPGKEVEILAGSRQVSAAPELPGFVLQLQRIWDPGW
jgi:Uma2 family endonuclease